MTPKEQVNGLQGRVKFFYTADFSVILEYTTTSWPENMAQKFPTAPPTYSWSCAEVGHVHAYF